MTGLGMAVKLLLVVTPVSQFCPSENGQIPSENLRRSERDSESSKADTISLNIRFVVHSAIFRDLKRLHICLLSEH